LKDEFFDRCLHDVLALTRSEIKRETRLIVNFGRTGTERLCSLLDELNSDQEKFSSHEKVRLEEQVWREQEGMESGQIPSLEHNNSADQCERIQMFYRDFSSAVLVDMTDLSQMCRDHGLRSNPQSLAKILVGGAPLVSFQCYPEVSTCKFSNEMLAPMTSGSEAWGEKGLAGLSLALSAIRLARVVERIFIVTSDPAFIPLIKTIRGMGAQAYVVGSSVGDSVGKLEDEEWCADGVIDPRTMVDVSREHQARSECMSVAPCHSTAP
jgi:hypothetical protein